MKTYKITVRAWEKNHTFTFKTDSLKSAIYIARKETMHSYAPVIKASVSDGYDWDNDCEKPFKAVQYTTPFGN